MVGTKETARASYLIQEVSAIERIALDRTEPRVGDQAAELLLGRGIGYPGGAHHVLLDQDAAHVVAAEAQSDLADFMARGEPGGLHVQDVVQIDAGDRQRLQV